MKINQPEVLRLRQILLVCGLGGASLQITLGSIVRVTGSGDACPDWPTCFGSLVPEFTTYQVVLEWTHRANGTALGILIIGVVLAAWIKRSSLTSAWVATIALVFVVVTGYIGARVVLTELNPAIRTLHLLLAEVTVLLLAVAFVRELNWQHRSLLINRTLSIWMGVTAVALVLAILVSGAYLVWRDLGAVCVGWPLCGGGSQVIPQTVSTWINMAHRLITLTALLGVAYCVHWLMRWARARWVRGVAIAALVLMVLEVLVGAAIPTSLLYWDTGYIWVKVVHLSVANLTWLAVCLLVSATFTLPKGSQEA